MTIEIIRPQSRADWLAGRTKTVGASEVAALFGAHPYTTPLELFETKQGRYAKEFAEAEIREHSIHIPPTERGNLFEDDAFELIKRLRPEWAEQMTLNQIPGGEVFVDRSAGMSSTPDVFVELGRKPRSATIQIKTMNDRVFRDSWKDGETITPPLSVAVQAVVDATLSGCDRAYAAAMVVGYTTDLYLIEVPLHPKLMIKARALVKDFWRRIEADEPYAPDFAKDGKLLAAIYADDDGGEVDLSSNNRIVELLAQREPLKAREKDGDDAAKERKVIDVEIIAALGNAARGLLPDGRVVEAKTIKRGGYTVQPTSYRTVKIKEAQSNGHGTNRRARPQQAAVAPGDSF